MQVRNPPAENGYIHAEVLREKLQLPLRTNRWDELDQPLHLTVRKEPLSFSMHIEVTSLSHPRLYTSSPSQDAVLSSNPNDECSVVDHHSLSSDRCSPSEAVDVIREPCVEDLDGTVKSYPLRDLDDEGSAPCAAEEQDTTEKRGNLQTDTPHHEPSEPEVLPSPGILVARANECSRYDEVMKLARTVVENRLPPLDDITPVAMIVHDLASVEAIMFRSISHKQVTNISQIHIECVSYPKSQLIILIRINTAQNHVVQVYFVLRAHVSTQTSPTKFDGKQCKNRCPLCAELRKEIPQEQNIRSRKMCGAVKTSILNLWMAIQVPFHHENELPRE